MGRPGRRAANIDVVRAVLRAQAVVLKQRMHEVLAYRLDHLSEAITQLDAMDVGPRNGYLRLADRAADRGRPHAARCTAAAAPATRQAGAVPGAV
jgi:hypothetical protein